MNPGGIIGGLRSGSRLEVSVREHVLPSGMRTVELENSRLLVTLLPDKGADIYSVYDKRKKLNLLYRSPLRELMPGSAPQPGSSEEQWMDRYLGGWQTMFPNAGAECNYKGATQVFHGEASTIPWEYRLGSCMDGIGFVIFTALLARTPFEVQKTVTLSPSEAELIVKERITNLGEEDIDYVWGHHIAFGAPFLSDRCVLHVPNDRMTVDSGQNGPHCRLSAGETLSWPMASTKDGNTVDFRKLPSANIRSADTVYLTGMKDGWYVLSNEEMQVNIGVRWDIRVFPYVWLWQELKGSFGYPFHGRCYVMGVEPCSTPFSGGLSESVEKGFASRLAQGESQETEISMIIFESMEPVRRILRD